jgi:hypothetical protein
MIGTALHGQSIRMMAPHGRLRARVATPRISVIAWLGSVFSDARHALSALVICAFIAGTVLCGPGEHEWFDGDQPSAAQSISASAASAAEAPADVVKGVPASPDTPAKGKVTGLCTGHCANHFVSLPGQFAQAVTPFDVRTVWVVFNDPRTMASHPPRLERPPRV